MSNNNNNNNSPESKTQPETSKKQKGRLKKLRKRAFEIEPNGPASGIQRSEEFKELQEFLQQDSSEEHRESSSGIIGPCVVWRKHKERDFSEGNDHRDILHRCLSTAANTENNQQAFPSWATLHNPALIRHIAVLEIHTENLGFMDIIKEKCLQNHQHISAFTRWFSGPNPRSISSTLMYREHTQRKRKNREDPRAVQSYPELYQNFRNLVISDKQWETEKYPEPRHSKQTSFTPTGRFSLDRIKTMDMDSINSQLASNEDRYHFTENIVGNALDTDVPPKIYGLDCEMVQTTDGLELARVTLVELRYQNPVENSGADGRDLDNLFSYDVVLDQLVKPRASVVDYLTPYSGIQVGDFDQVSIQLEHIQLFLIGLFRPKDILVGHSIENDLRALRIIHPLVIDTALLFRPKHARFKHKLQHLARVLLRKEIQNENHCSEEDAVTALELTFRRVTEGESFGIWERNQENQIVKHSVNDTVVCVGPSNWLQSHIFREPSGINIYTCEKIQDTNSKALASWLIGPRRRALLVWGRFTMKVEQDESCFIEFLDDLIRNYNRQDTIITIAIQSNIDVAIEIHNQRKAKKNPKATIGWTEKDEQVWRETVDSSRNGHVLWVGGLSRKLSTKK